MKTKIRVVILLAVLFLLVILSGCVTQPEKTPPVLDNKRSSQPISVTVEYGKTIMGYSPTAVTLSIVRTDGGELPELEAVLIDQTGKTVESDKTFYIKGAGISSGEILLQAESEGNYTIIVKDILNKTIYQTNWTISFPHYKINEVILMKNGISIVFRPYQIEKSFQEKGVNYKRLIIPIEVKNIESIKEERLLISAHTLKVDKGYVYKPYYPYDYVDSTLKPKEEMKYKIAFDIPEDTEPIEMHGLIGTDFILELRK